MFIFLYWKNGETQDTSFVQIVQMSKAGEAKPTDTSIPPSLKEHFPEQTQAYEELVHRERILDTMINRQILELQQYQQQLRAKEMTQYDDTLRLFVYTTVENQEWQQPQPQPGQEPSWTLRIEGKLLSGHTDHKMSWFLSGINVDLKGQGEIKGGPKLVEWHDDPKMSNSERLSKQFDGLDIKRLGSSVQNEIVADIVIQPKNYPTLLQVNNEALLELLGKDEISQGECIKSLLMYAKTNGLFEKSESEQGKPSIIMIKPDELFKRIIGEQSIDINKLFELVSTTLLKPFEPIRLSLPINTLKSSTLGEKVIDIKVNRSLLDPSIPKEIDEISKKITEEILDKESMDKLSTLDENLKMNIQMLNYSRMKYDFYNELSEDPVEFLKLVMAKNDEYLSILTSDALSFGKNGLADEERVRRSDFYTDEFLREHVNLLFNSGRL